MISLSSNIEQHYLQHEFATSETLVEEPIGWKTSTKKLERSKTTGEFIEKNSKEISFIGKGRDYIKSADAIYGTNCKIRYTIIKENPEDSTDYFQDDYFLDLESLKDKDGKLSIKINEGGLAVLLKSKQNEKVEIDRETSLEGKEITSLNFKKLLIKGRKIFLKSIFQAETKVTSRTTINDNDGDRKERSIPFPMTVSNANNSDKNYIYSPINTMFSASERPGGCFYLKNDRAKKLKLTFNNLSIWVKPTKVEDAKNVFLKVKLTIYENGDNFDFKEEHVFFTDPNPRSGTRRKITIPNTVLNIDLQPGESMSFEIRSGGNFGEGWFNGRGYYNVNYDSPEGELLIEEDSEAPSTDTKCIYSHEYIDRLLEIITGKKGLFYSESLGLKELGYKEDGFCANTVIYSLLWARGFSVKDKKRPSFSFKDTIESLSAIWGLTSMVEKVGFKERFRMEDISFFYNHNVTIRIPNIVEDFEEKKAVDFMYTSYELGFQKGGDDYEEATGVGEYNGKARFTTIRNRKEKVLSLLSKLRGDYSAKEFARRLRSIQQDSRYDNDWFIDEVKKSATDVLEEQTYLDVCDEVPEGIYSPETAGNLRMTPKQMLKRRKFFVSGNLSKYQDSDLVFTSSNCNSDLSLKIKGKEQSLEKENIKVSSLGRPRFKASLLKFKTNITFDLQKKLRSKVVVNGREIYAFYGLMEFRVSENQYKYGYIFEVNENSGVVTLLEANY